MQTLSGISFAKGLVSSLGPGHKLDQPFFHDLKEFIMQSLQPLLSLDQPKPARQYATLAAILVSLWLVLTIVGCSKESQTGNATDSTSATSAAPTQSQSSATPAHLTDTNIVAVLRETDSAEISLGKLALAKTKNGAIKGFAKMMVDDHSKMLNGDNDLAKKLNLTPVPPANDSGPAHLTSEISSLNSAAPQSFDSIYINDAVADHSNALSAIKGFESQASSQDLKNGLNHAIPIVQQHLDRAKAVQSELSKPKPMAAEKKNQ